MQIESVNCKDVVQSDEKEIIVSSILHFTRLMGQKQLIRRFTPFLTWSEKDYVNFSQLYFNSLSETFLIHLVIWFILFLPLLEDKLQKNKNFFHCCSLLSPQH